MKILFLGTTSGAGKTIMAAMFCRYLGSMGIRAAPFKASNLSSASFIMQDGREIGKGQAFQALACGIDPSADMNPVLMKPAGNGVRLLLNGIESDIPRDDGRLADEVLNAYDRLSKRYEAIVSEGSGSPAELNMMKIDIANIRVAAERSVPCVLVGDIDKGGVFAGLYGTWKLLPKENRDLLKGFIINRFRGDPSILVSGLERITELTGMKCLGVMPMTPLEFPNEDSLSVNSGNGNESDIQYLNNLDAFVKIAKRNLDLDELVRISSA